MVMVRYIRKILWPNVLRIPENSHWQDFARVIDSRHHDKWHKADEANAPREQTTIGASLH